VLFMVAMALVVVPGGLAFAVWRSYVRAQRRPGSFAPDGKLRWDEPPRDPPAQP
jgi:hypothetical protein